MTDLLMTLAAIVMLLHGIFVDKPRSRTGVTSRPRFLGFVTIAVPRFHLSELL